MTVKHFFQHLAAGALAVAGLCSASGAQAADYTITQQLDSADSMTPNGLLGTLSGSFTADDTDLNGVIELAELNFFSVSFAGTVGSGGSAMSFGPLTTTDVNLYVYDFSWTIGNQNPDSFGVTGTIDPNGVGTGFTWAGAAAGSSRLDYYFPDPGDANNQLLDTSFGPEAVVTSPAVVPEPETYALMLGGLSLLGWMRRRQRQALAGLVAEG
jgi:hypothetical protein